ncbi:hypothetical protein DYBT9275_00958 [Dyadobacter sp. CECT 9275]|uniref:Glycoside hydrolase family 127 protein n=1 Tax=Dyadobacter helix TaxID=2822344 RepID=A0A916J8X7_9BACT|nr:beta-L-arabinofuranosidase domain-containing protein [Dyadobacter sp. CECT 9275]CAG4992418.1 hypothetical protein DYBT9275_00958 [Dyadobacter sp. CECT 9275]
MTQRIIKYLLLGASWCSGFEGFSQVSRTVIGDLVKPEVRDVFLPVDASRIKVGGEMGRRISITEHDNLESLHLEKYFIEPFHNKKRSEGFVGTGMLIDAVTKMAAHSMDPKTIRIKNQLVDQLIATQEQDGYIGMFIKPQRMWVLWDVHEMSYITFGLLTDYQLFGNKKSLDAATRTADYIMANWAKMPAGWEKNTGVNLFEAMTGLDRAMLTLYRLTGNRKYLDFSLQQKKLKDWNLDIEIGRRLGLNGHVYGFLGMCLSQLELYRLNTDRQLLSQTNKAIDFLTNGNGAVVSGAVGQWEAWTNDQDGENALGETCASAYQIRVYENLFRLFGESRFGDLMERTIFNTLFAAQSPEGAQIRYYAPLVGPRKYFQEEGYCCPNNYRRIVSELPFMIYYRGAGAGRNGVSINLYTASSASIDLPSVGRVKLEQQTDYPNNGKVIIRVSPSKAASFALNLRIPAWAKTARISINGSGWTGKVQAGSQAVIERKWSAGDEVVLEMPMEPRLVRGRQRQAGRVAIMRGPVLFCLNPDRNPGVDKPNKEVDPSANLNGFDLGRMVLDPASISEVEKDNTIRPDGISLKIKAWREGWTMGPGSNPTDMELLLTEFSDPGGRATYFRLADLSAAVDDELFMGK